MGARILSAAMSLAYVGSVYIFPGGRPRIETVGVLARRLSGVIILTSFAVANFGYNGSDWLSADAFSLIKALAVLHVLYLAQLTTYGPADHSLEPRDKDDSEERWLMYLRVLKNFIVGPASEELVYRGVILAIYRHASLSDSAFLRDNCLYFGLAHMHHAIMRYLDGYGGFKLNLFQAFAHFIMTSIFGVYSAFLLLRTGSIWPSIFSHALCNYYGPPKIHGTTWWFKIEQIACLVCFIYALKFI